MNIVLNDKKHSPTNHEILGQALDYYRRGWSIIPVRAATKIATVEWKQYQDQRPEEGQIRDWFSGPERQNIAVVLGEVSGGLTCRDFDTMESYEAWAHQYTELAATLPTVETSRGKHVYFLSNHRGIRKLNNGELRGAGGYCLLPPSVHPDGSIYEWIIPLGETIPTLVPEEIGVTEDTQVTQDTQETQDIEAIVLLNTEPLDVRIEKAIRATTPSEEGQRNQKIFKFARYLKSFPELVDKPPQDLKPYVRQWHTVALPFISTKPFDVTWSDFTVGWKRVKWPIGNETLVKAINIATQAKDVLPEAMDYEDDTRLLIRVCYELQKLQGTEPFWISCWDAKRFMGISHKSANKRLHMLVNVGILKLVETGCFGQKKATRYQYIARQPVQMGMEATYES